MNLFQTNHYVPAEIDRICALPTPLGYIERRYVENADKNYIKAKRNCHRHNSRNCMIYEWASQNLEVEELVVTFTSPEITLPPNATCYAVVGRIKVLVPIQEFDAEIIWAPDCKWDQGCGEPGEGIEAREWSDEKWKVVIGTEDSEFLASRSRSDRWLPRRLANYFDDPESTAVRVKDKSLSVHFPELKVGEFCQFQFVIVSGPHQRKHEITYWLLADLKPSFVLDAADCT